MVKRNILLAAPPFAVEQSLKGLGERLRTARLRRNLTLAEVGAKIGTGIRAVRDAENGRASASIGTYWALLWAHDLLGPTEDLADPAKDVEGNALETRRARGGGRSTKALLSRDEATRMLSQMEVLVQQRWYEVARREGVSEQDCQRITTAFAHQGFRLPLKAAASSS